MHLRSLKKARKDVSLHDSIGTDKEGNEITTTFYTLMCYARLNRVVLIQSLYKVVRNTEELVYVTEGQHILAPSFMPGRNHLV